MSSMRVKKIEREQCSASKSMEVGRVKCSLLYGTFFFFLICLDGS